MRLTPPKQVVFKWSFALAILGVVAAIASFFVAYAWLMPVAVVLLAVAYGLLAAGNALKGF